MPLLLLLQAVSCINLVNQHGSEGTLEKAMARESKRYTSSKSAALSYTAFDFHKQCGATNYGRWAAPAQVLSMVLATTCLLQRDRRLHGLVLRCAWCACRALVQTCAALCCTILSNFLLCCVVPCCVLQAVSPLAANHSRVQALWAVPHRHSAQQAAGAHHQECCA